MTRIYTMSANVVSAAWRRATQRLLVVALVAGCAAASVVVAQEAEPNQGAEITAPEMERRFDIDQRLRELHEVIAERNAELRALADATPGAGVAADLSTAEDIAARVAALRGEVEELRTTFEDLAIGGVDRSAFSNEPETAFDWQSELVEIARPIFDALKDITEKGLLSV